MSRRLEIGALVALCVFLPLYEAPKSIFWALYVVLWIVNRVRARDFGGRWDAWDSLIAAWIVSGFAAAAFAGVRGGDEWRAPLDLLRYGSVLWLARRSRYAPGEVALALGALVFSTLVGLGMAYVAMWRGKGGGLQLNSVGHVNHTAIYLAIMFGVAVTWLFAAWQGWTAGARALGLAATLCILVGLVTTASRGAVGVGVLLSLLLALGWWRRSRVPLVVGAAALVVTAAALFAGGAEVLRKHEANVKANNVLSYRGEVWSMGLAAWREHPWFGVGMDNYGRITPYRRRLEQDNAAAPTHDPTAALEFAHGHSLFVNTLTERGLVGLAALAALLGALGLALVRNRPPSAAAGETWLLWGAALGAWLVTVGVGVFNTTLHHEHGILFALLAGFWLSRLPKR